MTGYEELVSVLKEARRHLGQSEESAWAALTPHEVVALLDREIASLESDQRLVNPVELASLFAPTAEIQEISMASGWGDYYLELAAHFDDVLAACDEERPA